MSRFVEPFLKKDGKGGKFAKELLNGNNIEAPFLAVPVKYQVLIDNIA